MNDAKDPAPNAAGEDAPRPLLSVSSAVMIIAGIVMGGGIFAFPPLVATMAGSVRWMFAAWVTGAVLSLIGALCYAELATLFPSAGGDYHFLTKAYGRDVSFFFAWARMTVVTTGAIALLAFIFGDHASRVLSLGSHSSAIHASIIVVALTGVNLLGLKESARAQNVMSLALIAGMAAVIMGGVLSPAGVSAAGSASPTAAAAATATAAVPAGVPPLFGTALLFVLFTYGGWNEAAYISSEVRGGPRSIVRVLVLSLGLVTLVYLSFVFALTTGLGFTQLAASRAPAADVTARAFGRFGEAAIGGLVALSALKSINATMLVAARTNYALGQDWTAFRFMSRWSGTRNTPIAAVLVTGGMSLALVLFASISKSGVQAMVDFTAPVFWFFFLLTGIALFVIRRRSPELHRPFEVPLYPVLPAIFCMTCAFLLYRSLVFTMENQSVRISLYVMAAGILVWLGARLRTAV
ncbi:MAG TPA: amino acid permease [Polyangiaceae bacterium]